MRKFTPQEDRFILDNYLTMPMTQISRKLGRSKSAARQRLHRLGYSVPKEVARQFALASYIKKGNISHNKGKPMPDHVKEKVKQSWFSKGHLPHNTKQDGMVVTRTDKTGRPYLYIRVSKAKWEPLHREVWRKHKGEIPTGYIVAFKDGNSQNCAIENLELITRTDNMQRNTIHNLPEAIRNTKLLIGSLNRKINNHVKNH